MKRDDVIIKRSMVGLLELVVAAVVGVGSLIAYTENKYASKESIQTEIVERQKSNDETQKNLLHIDEKLDKIYLFLIKQKEK